MSDLLNYVKKHSPSIDRQDEIRQAILKWRKENPIEAPKNNDDDSVFEAGWQGLKANTGSLIQTVSDAIIDSGKPKDVTMEDWKADIVENSPFGWNPVVAASEFGAEIAKENARTYTPMSANSIAYGIGGVAPYAVGLGVTGAAAARTGNYKALGDIARTAAGQAVTKASGMPVFGATIARHSPAITKAAGVVAPAATVGAMQTVPEAMVERQSTMDEYVADAKKNNTYVKGQTEAEAREIANRVAADNVGLLTGTNTLEQALLARTPVGKLGRIAKQVGVGAGLNAAEEGAQTIFPLTEAGKSWNWNDPQLLESMVVGGLFGGAAQGVGAATGAYLDNKTASTEPIAKEKPATIKANATSGNEDIDRIILEKSKQYGIDPDLVHAVIWKESRYNPKAVSPVGAVGLMQLMEGTAGDLGVTNREDIEQNIDGGIRYLKQMYEKNGGDWNAQDRETWEKALASYNGGYGNRNLTQTRLYAHDVWNKYNEFRGENADADITATDADTDDVSTIDTEDVERNAIEYAKHKIDKSDEDYTFLNDAIRRNDKQAVMDKYSAQDIQDWADSQVLNDQKLNEKYMKNRDANIKKILQNGEIKITNRQMLPFYRQNDTFRGGTIKKVEGGYLYTPPKDFMNRAEVGRIAEENGITEMPVKESPQAQRDEMWGTKNDTLEQQLAKAHKRDEQKQLDEWAKEYAEEEELAGYEKEYARQDLATVLNNISAKKKGEQELLDQWAKEYEAEEARVNQWVADEEAREQAEAQEKQALTQRMADTLNNLIATGREDTARRLLQVLNSPQVTDNAIANDEELARQMAEGRARADQERRKEKYRAYQAEKEAKAREGLNQRLTNAIAGILENERNDLAGQMAEGRENAVQERQAREDLSQRLANAVAGILENERTTLANQMAEGREQAEKQRKQEAEANAPAEEVTAEPKQEKTEEKTEEAVPETETVEETPKESVEESSEAEPQEGVSEKENIAEEKESESEEKKDSLSSAKPKKGRWWREEYPDKKSKTEFILEKSEVTEESATILDAVSEDEEYLSRLIEEERASLADLKKQFGKDWLSGMREVRDETAKQYKALIEKYAKMMLDRVLTNKNDAWVKEYLKWYLRLLNEGKTKQERLGIMLEGLRKEATHQLRNRPIDAKLGKPLIGEESCTKFAELEAVLDGYAYIQVEADKYHELQSKGKTSVNIAETDIQGETENAKTQQRTSGRSEKKGEKNNRVRDLKSKTPQREVKYTFVIDGEGKNPTELRNALPKQGMVDRSFQKYTDGRIEVQYYNNMQKNAYDSVTALGFKPKDEKSKFDKATAEQFPRIDTHNERLEEFYNNVRDWCKKQGTGTLAKIVGKSKAQWFAAEGDTNHSPTGFLDFCNQAVLKGYKLPQKWVKLYKDTRKGREEMYEAFEDIGKTTPQEADTIEFNLETDDATSREYRHDVMKKNGFTDNAIAELDKRIKRVAKIVKEVSDLHKDFGDWQRVMTERLQEDGILVPKVNAFIKNGEYQLNMDLGTLCIKREGVDAAIQVMLDMDDVNAQNLGASQIWQMCDVLKKNGYLVPCEVCFVESKRVRALDTANAISLHWKAVLDALGINDGKKLGEPRTLTAEQQEKLDRMARTSQKDKDIREAAYDELIADKYKREYDVKVSEDGKETKTALDNGLTPDKMARIASLMKQDNRLIGEFDAENIMTSANTDKLLNEYHHTDLPGFLASADGAATAKPLQGRHVYDGLSFKTVYDNTKKTVAYVFDIGGVRLQSFSDFDVMLFFDYVQFIADLEARILPAHAYAKIPEFVEFFKKTRIKINMSLLYGISEEVDANGNKPPAGLQFAKDENGNIKYDRKGNPKYDYLYVDESFGAKQGVSGEEGAKRAFALRDKEGDVGTIGVGLSDEHIEKMLADDRIDMVIPYHASGMPKSIQIRSGLYKAIDYSKQQNTKKKKKAKSADKEQQSNDAVEKEYPFNKKLREIGDPRKTAEDYLAWCEKNGYTPKFPQFAKNDNYYKLLADFRVYDGKGEYAPQKSVQLKLPRNIKSLLKARVAERVSNVEQVKNIAQNEALVKELKDTVTKYERIDNLTLEEMKKRLNSVLKTGKGDAVVSLRSEEFFNELDRLAEAGKGVTKEQVEVLRTSNKVVYGFAVGGKIYLNENYTNANTPAHEFTHIWAKVVKANNPKLWKQGVNLLKTDPRSKEIWDEVVNDPNYESIRDNEDAVASEVLARIVGGENEKLVKEIFNNANGKRATHTKSFGAKLMDWIKSFFGNVIDILGLDRDVDYDEFIKAPLGAIWDEEAGKSFNKALKKWQAMEKKGSVASETEFQIVDWAKNKFGKTKNLTHELRVKDAITNLTGLKVAWGHTDKDIIYDEKQGVIRTRTAQDWGRVVPQVAEVIAKRLGMGIKTVDGEKTVDPAMKDYITEYIFTGALTKANTKEAKEFERVMQKNPKESEDILALRCEFERYGALTLSEQAMENLETDVKQSRTLKQKAVWMMMKLVDKYYPVRLMSMKMYEKFKELGEEMPRYLNPNTIVKNVSGATAQASMLIHLPQKRFSANATENKKLIMESIEATKDMIRREFPSVEESLIEKFKPLELILQEAGMYGDDTEAKKFQTYMVARRMLELHDREGIEEFPEVYNTPEKCEQIIAELENPAYIQAAEDLYNLQTLSLAIQVDCGTLSQTYFDRVTNENKNYIPLRRLIDDEKMTNNADSTKKVEGSARVVWAPFDQAMDNIANGFVKAQKNKAMAQVGQAAKLLGQAKTIEVVENNQPNSRNVVSYLVNGERVYIEAYPELAMSLKHITESRAATGVIKILSMANRVPRELLTTNNPEFALSAFFRDAMNFFLYEKGNPVDLFKGLKHTLLRDSVFQEYMTSGASQSVLTAADKDYFARNVTGSDKGSLSGFKNVIKALDKITSAPTEVMEQAVRVAAYEKTKNRVMKEELDNLEAKLRKSGMTEAQIQQAIQEYGMKDAIMTATVEARLAARDLMDFASRGEWGDALNSYSWFANAVIQGGYKSVRALNWKDPANKGKIQGRLLRLAGVCILQAALSAMGEDDDEIKGLSDADRYMYFHVRVGDSVLRIPKGDDLGIRTLTFWIDMAFNKREATLRRAMLPLENAFPNLLFMSALKPVVEVLANYSFFYNSEIVPKRLQNPALPEREHDAFTSRLAKEIGEAFHWSPKKVDYMMNAYFGGLGRAARGTIDWATEGKAPKEMAVVRRFVVPKGKTSVFVNDAYEYISEQDALYKDWQERRKTDPRSKADERFDKAKYTRLKYDKEKLKELTEKIRKNRENPRITEAQREANHIAFTKARNKLAESIMFR